MNKTPFLQLSRPDQTDLFNPLLTTNEDNTAIDTFASNIDAKTTANTNAITAEVQRASAAEQALNSAITTESQRATAVEQLLSSNLNNKVDKVPGAVSGNIPVFTTGGAISDSGRTPNSFLATPTGETSQVLNGRGTPITPISIPTNGSTLPFTAGGAYAELAKYTKRVILYNGTPVYIGVELNEEATISYINAEGKLPDMLIISLETFNASPASCILGVGQVARSAIPNGTFAVRLLSISNNAITFNVAQTSITPRESIYIRKVEGLYNVN